MINRKAFLLNAIEEGFKNDVSGYPLSLKHSKGKNLKDYKIYGNSVQKGANLFDGTYKNGYIFSNEIFAFSETTGNQYLLVMPCDPNTTYILEKEYATKRFIVGFTDEYPYTGCPIIGTLTQHSAKKITATSGENSQYLVAFIYNKTIDTLPLPNVEIYKEQSPDNPIEIQSVGDLVTDENDANYGKYKIPVKVSGKNLFSYKILLDNDFIEVLDEKTGEFIFKKVSKIPSTYINAKQNTIYNISGFVNVTKQQSISIVIYYTDGSYSRITEYDTVIGEYVKFTGTSQANKTIDYIKFGGAGGLALETKFKEIQITETIEDKYEPYIEPITTNIYLNEPLRKIGDYADYVDFANNKVVRKIYGKALTSNLAWRDTYFPTLIISLKTEETADGRVTVLSKYASNPNIEITNASGTGIGVFNTSTYWNCADMAEFKVWLDEHKDFVAYYPLKTPTEETIELPNIPTHKGTNIIKVDTIVEASNLNVSYKSFEKGE